MHDDSARDVLSTNNAKDDGMKDERFGNHNQDEPVDRWRDRLRPVRPRRSSSAEHRTSPSTERPRTVAEAADELGLSVHTVRAWIAVRRIAHIRLGRAIRIPAGELRRLIDAGTVPAERK
jgi:excisionase family DNA binding protein